MSYKLRAMCYKWLIANFVIILALLVFPGNILAQEVDGMEISPHIIDVKVKARDILEYDVIIRNNGERRVTMYVLVYDVSPEDNHQEILAPGQLDKSASITRWVRISRGAIELDPGQETSIPLTIEVNLSAKPGKYYAAIVFAKGRNITMAQESFENSNQLKLILNLEVEENIVEKAQVQALEAGKNIFLKFPALFYFNIINSGNRDIIPQGYLYIYNRKNQEIAKLPANAGNESVAPESDKKFNILWDKGRGFGKFKAKLELEYGQKETRDLHETLYFWVLPWQLAIIFGGGLLATVIILVILIFKKTYTHGGSQPLLNNEATVDLRGKRK
ncbi:MAG: hypothetical protein U9R06_00755 [Patescibacteria group bacterium]|nr:hypothetical protein [Patescibacteria group bacterium]